MNHNENAAPEIIQFPERQQKDSRETGEAAVIVLHEWRHRNHPSVVRDER